MKKHYHKDWKGKRTLVGYKVNTLYELAKQGYFIQENFKDMFLDYKKADTVYVDLEFRFLCQKGKYIIPVYSKEAYGLDWDKYLKNVKQIKVV